MRFHVGVLLALGGVLAADGLVRFGKGFLHVADASFDVVDDVVLAVVNTLGIRLIMNDGCAGFEGVQRGQYWRQYLVFHVDQLQCLLGQLRRIRGHNGHAVANVAHLVIQAHLVVGLELRVALPARSVFNARQVLIGQHGAHPGQGAGAAGIDLFNIGVGVRAGEQCSVEHALHVHIIGEDGFAAG